MTSPLLTVQELANVLRVSENTVYRQCRAGLWPCTRIARQLRFTDDHIDAIVALGEQPSASSPPQTRRPAPRPAVVLDPLETARRKIA